MKQKGKFSSTTKSTSKSGFKPKRPKSGQPRKDSKDPRVNFDNTRLSKFEKDENFSKTGTGSTNSANDFEWYNRNPSLTLAATRLGSTYIQGTKIPDTSSSAPTVLAIRYSQVVPTQAPAVKTAQDMEFSFVMHANSRNYQYTGCDQNIFQLAGFSLISCIGMGIRMYGSLRKFSGENAALPRVLIEAMGFDYDDIRKNYSIIWGDLNYMISMLSQIWVPTEIPLLYRWFWMNTKIFVDSDNVKDQYYILVPMGFWRYEGKKETTGSSLQWESWANAGDPNSVAPTNNVTTVSFAVPGLGAADTRKVKWAEYKELFYKLLNSLVESQDRGVIYADILRAFGTTKLFALVDIPVDYTTEFAYEPEVLTQIMNATLCPMLPKSVTQDVDKDILIQNWPSLRYNEVNWPADNNTQVFCRYGAPIVNFKMADEPTPQAIIESTRLVSRGLIYDGSSNGTNGYNNVRPKVCATEIVNGMIMYYNTWSESLKSYSTSKIAITAGMLYGKSNWSAPGSVYEGGRYLYSAFDWRPLGAFINTDMDVKTSSSTSAKGTDFADWNIQGRSRLVCVEGELENIVPISDDEMERLHNVCVLSEFGMPFDFSTFKTPSKSSR